jgi:hypothetical protein
VGGEERGGGGVSEQADCKLSDRKLIELVKRLAEYGPATWSLGQSTGTLFTPPNGMYQLTSDELNLLIKADAVAYQVDLDKQMSSLNVTLMLNGKGIDIFEQQFPGYMAVKRSAMKALPLSFGGSE